MSISATDGVGSSYLGGAATSTTSTSESATESVNKDMFLKLMVAQLKNQDPSNPTDSSQFLAQTAQFTSLEKLETVADQNAQLLSAQAAFGASNLVGRTVTYTGADGTESTGPVTSVRFTASGPLLGVGSDEVTLGNVSTVTG